MLSSVMLRAALMAAGLSTLSLGLPSPAGDTTEQEVAARDVNSTSGFRYLNSKTSKYRVESLPVISNRFDIGEMYSGLIPVYDSPSRELFFIFQPTIGPPVDEITIWFNGGPGCSSMEGFLQENGRFRWLPGQTHPTLNQYSWVNLTNMLWIEQPVTTGFSVGKPNATNEADIAADVVAWFKNFQDVFSISNYKIYVTGESYAGRYVPYVSGAFLDQKNTKNYDLKGALVYDPCIGQFNVENNIAAVPFAQENQELLNLDPSVLSKVESLQEACGFTNYIEKYLSYPPPGPQPRAFNATRQCDTYGIIYENAYKKNPCFNPYEVSQMCPNPSTVLPQGGAAYFNRTDVKKALHAPVTANWQECGGTLKRDTSPLPIEAVLPQVIEATNRVLVSNGDYDYVLITNGTLLAIQNMTWSGKQGFQTKPTTPINIELGPPKLPPQGDMGIQHYERGLMWAETFQAGHMQPEFQPRVTYRHLQWLLGKINSL